MFCARFERFQTLRCWFAALVGLCGVCALAHPARAESPEIASIRASISENNQRATKLYAQLRALQAEKSQKLAEMRAGMFCSGCGQTRSEILVKGEQFPHPGQHIIAATQEQLNEVAAEFDDKIKALTEELRALSSAHEGLNRRAMQIQMEESRAAWQKQLDEQRARAEANQRRLNEQFDQLQESLRSVSKQMEEQRARGATEELSRQQDEARRLRDQEQQLVVQAAQQWAAVDVSASQRPAAPQPLDEYSKAPFEPSAAPAAPRLTPAQQAEQKRLQELADSGLVVGPSSFDLDGIGVVADQGVSLWNRVMDLKSGVEDVGRAAARVAAGEEVDFQTRVKLIKDNALSQMKLNANVLDSLTPAAEALARGDTEKLADVQGGLDRSTAAFADAARERAARASPAFDLMNSASRLRDTAQNATKPAGTFSNSQDRARAYSAAGKSAWDAAMNLRGEKAEGTPPPVSYGPRSQNGWGPLGEQSSTYFPGGVYTAKRQTAPIELYRWERKVGQDVVTYWSARAPSDAGHGAKPVRIRLPANQQYFECPSHDSADESLIMIKDFDSNWIVK